MTLPALWAFASDWSSPNSVSGVPCVSSVGARIWFTSAPGPREVTPCVLAADTWNCVCSPGATFTMAGVTVNEGYDPDVAGDLVRRLERLAPRGGEGDRHAEGNSDAHLAVALVGTSVLLPVTDNGLRLGRWQRIFLLEWDGPRARRLHVSAV